MMGDNRDKGLESYEGRMDVKTEANKTAGTKRDSSETRETRPDRPLRRFSVQQSAESNTALLWRDTPVIGRWQNNGGGRGRVPGAPQFSLVPIRYAAYSTARGEAMTPPLFVSSGRCEVIRSTQGHESGNEAIGA
jgi:hypothetical protein